MGNGFKKKYVVCVAVVNVLSSSCNWLKEKCAVCVTVVNVLFASCNWLRKECAACVTVVNVLFTSCNSLSSSIYHVIQIISKATAHVHGDWDCHLLLAGLQVVRQCASGRSGDLSFRNRVSWFSSGFMRMLRCFWCSFPILNLST
jgi:hypothetical protein